MSASAALRTPAAASTGVTAFLDRFAATRGQLPGDGDARAAAAEALTALGLPGTVSGRRPEAWHFTSLRPLAGLGFAAPERISGGALEIPGLDLAALAMPRVVFTDGVFDAAASSPPGTGFATAAKGAGLADAASLPLVALNAMLAEDGARIDVPEGVDAGALLLVHRATQPGTSAHPRHVLRLGAGAKLSVIEIATGVGESLHNPVSEIVLEDGAELHHLRLQMEDAAAFHLASIHARLGAKAAYRGFTLALGARLARTDLHLHMTGPGAHAAAHATQLLGGRQHGDITSLIVHDAPGCESRQMVKNVLTGQAHGVFQGQILVDRLAQKTDGYQMHQALLLSDQAAVDCKPQLQIFADDVKCSHGATVGALDADQMFYLQSRGVPREQARAMLVRAFLDDALADLTDPVAHRLAEQAVAGFFERLPA